MKRNTFTLVSALFVTVVILTACASDKGPAEQAVKAAEEAVNLVKGEAVKYVPDEVKSLESALAALKDKLAKGEYKAVITEGKALGDKAKEVATAAEAKKDEFTKTWTELSERLPRMVEAIQSRVDILAQSKKLPANLTAEKFEQAKSGLAAAKEEWAKALESFKGGMLTEAIAMANSVKKKAVQTMEILGLPVPSGAQA